MADEPFITTIQEVAVITETPADAQYVETAAEEHVVLTTPASSATVTLIESEVPAEVSVETETVEPQIIRIETTGPQGAPGEKGEKGDKGETGEPGLISGAADGDFLRYDIETESWAPERAVDTLSEFKADSDIAGAISNSHASGSDNQDLSGLMVKSANLSDVADTAAARGHLGVPTLSEVKADADIADALSKKHGNTLDHTQGTDQYLDHGGSNQVTAAQVKTAVSNAHAPGSDNQDLSGYMQGAHNLSDVSDAAASFAAIKQAATETATGVVELSTDSETIAGTSRACVVTPANLTTKLGMQTDGAILVGGGPGMALEALSVGLTTEMLVGGGLGANPVWTAATGSGAPVRANSPLFVSQITTPKIVSANISTPPSAAVPDAALVWSEDLYGVAGKSTLHTYPEGWCAVPLATVDDFEKFNAKSWGGGVSYSTSTAYYAMIAQHDASLNLPAFGAMTWIWEGLINDATPASSYGHLFHKHNGTTGYIVGINSTGNLYLTLNSTTYQSTKTLPNRNFVHANITVTLREGDTGRAGYVLFNFNGNQLGNSVPVSITATCENTEPLYIAGSPTARMRGVTYNFAILNRYLLPASNELNVGAGILDNYDQWGSHSPIYQSNFSAGEDGWTTLRGTATGNIDGISGKNDTLRFYANSDAATAHYFGRASSEPSYQFTNYSFWYYIPAANTHVDGLRVNGGEDFTVTGSWAFAAGTLVSSSTTFIIYEIDGTTTSFTGAGVATDDLVYIYDLKIWPAGGVICCPGSSVQPRYGQWLDTSSNKNHVLPHYIQTSAVNNVKNTFEIKWTCSWSETHEAQYLGGVNTYIFPIGGYIEHIYAVVSGTNVQDIIIGNTSDTDYWMAATTGLTAGVYDWTPANRVANGSLYKMTVDPDANATMNITFTITGIILD